MQQTFLKRWLSQTPTAPGGRVEYIDGIRALAALSVVVLHAMQMRGYSLESLGITPDLLPESNWVSLLVRIVNETIGTIGISVAVQAFIVISGYTLMISAVKSADGRPKGGLKGYFQRRIRRIWPPYYAALILSLLIILLIPGMNVDMGGYHDQAVPVTVEGLTAHLLFVHSWNPSWASQINTPMWTIAVEEQIYVLFPLILLPIWRRFNVLWLPLVAMVIPAFLALVLPYPVFAETRAWFFILFAIGAVAASINFSNRPFEVRWRDKLPWLAMSVVFALVWLVIKFAGSRLGIDGVARGVVNDILIGLATGSLLIHCTNAWNKGFKPLSLVGIFNSRVLVSVGVFSYSLYLIHVPVLSLLTHGMRNLGINNDLFYILMLLLCIPVSVAVAYLFSLVFERPFMPKPSAGKAIVGGHGRTEVTLEPARAKAD